MQSLKHEPVVVHGDGRQVRDLLFIDDLLDAFDAALANMDMIAGQAFNIGGGPARTISPLELLALVATKLASVRKSASSRGKPLSHDTSPPIPPRSNAPAGGLAHQRGRRNPTRARLAALGPRIADGPQAAERVG